MRTEHPTATAAATSGDTNVDVVDGVVYLPRWFCINYCHSSKDYILSSSFSPLLAREAAYTQHCKIEESRRSARRLSDQPQFSMQPSSQLRRTDERAIWWKFFDLLLLLLSLLGWTAVKLFSSTQMLENITNDRENGTLAALPVSFAASLARPSQTTQRLRFVRRIWFTSFGVFNVCGRWMDAPVKYGVFQDRARFRMATTTTKWSSADRVAVWTTLKIVPI